MPDATVESLRKNIEALLGQVGEPTHCRGCDARIWMVVHRNGRRAPYTGDGLNHFADCPKAKEFKR